MKKSLLFMAFLFILGGLCVNAADIAVTMSAFSGTVGDAKTVETDGFVFNFAKNNGQTAPTYNSKAADVRVYAKGTLKISSTTSFEKVVFNISAQGQARLAPITVSVGELATQTKGDKTVTWTSSTPVTEVTFTVGDKADFGSDGSSKGGQLCFDGLTISTNGEIQIEPVDYEPNFEDITLYEGDEEILNLGSKHPSVMNFVSSDENIVAVTNDGIITANGLGNVNISVSWEADDNFNASKEDVVFNVTVIEKPLAETFDFSVENAYGMVVPSSSGDYASTPTTCKEGIVTCVIAGKYRAWMNSNKYDIRLYKADSGKDNVGTFTLSVPKGYKLVTVEFTKGISSDFSLTASVGTIENRVWTAPVAADNSEIVFTASGTTTVSKIIVSYAVTFPKFDGTEHSFTTESSEIRIADADHAFDIYYLHTPAPAQNNVVAYAEGEADNFENKAEFDEANGEHVIPVSESGTLSYYAVHTATGAQSETSHIAVTKTATTAIDAIGADAAEGEVEFFDIRGVKVNIDNAAPGLYIRRQGTTATKVIVK